jgi:hypothetical protein
MDTVLSQIYMIKNKFGLHARPSASFVQTASRFRSDIKVEKDGQEADGKSWPRPKARTLPSRPREKMPGKPY